MNRNRLLSRLAEASDAVERPREELNQIEGDKDEFAAFLFQARRQFRRSVDTSTKSGKRIQDTIRSTFKEAISMGYRGPYEGWIHLLDIPTVKPAEDRKQHGT